QNMHFHHCSHVGGLKRVMLFVLLTFLVSGEKKEAVFGLSNQKPNIQEKQWRQRKQLQHKEQVQKYPFDVFVSEKREVPNASDPLHNR
ncbi:hypothetical protein TanjilG_08210, partial [Lupinus angustifolius]